MTKYISEDYEKVVKEFEKGKFPGEPIVKKYEHPVKNRKIIKSETQIRDTRR